mgnify:CR=1 FL=1
MTDEYISREAALKAANEWVSEACMAPVMRISRLFDKLQKVPAADVAPVVRCRDCEYVRPAISASTGERVGVWCALHDILNVGPDDFCSRGLRKGGNDNVSG